MESTATDELIQQLERHWREKTGMQQTPFRRRLDEWLKIAPRPQDVFFAITKTGSKIQHASSPFSGPQAVAYCGNVVRSTLEKKSFCQATAPQPQEGGQ